MPKMREKLGHLREEAGPMVRLAAPIVMAEIGWVAMGIVDTMMVGRLPNGTEAIGAVSIGSVLFYVIGIFGGGMLLGLDTLVAQSFGAGQVDDCHRSLLNAIYFLLALTPLLMLVVWLSVPVLRMVGVAPAVLELTVPYLGALLWSAPPLMLYFAFRRYLQAMNLVLPVALAMISANLVNAFANWVLIYGKLGAPAMGVVGAGWATCISRAYTAVFLLLAIFYYEHKHQMGLRAVAFKPDLARIARLIRLGFPAAMHITLEVGVFAAATALAGRLGAVPLAAHQVALQTASLTFMVPLGMASAAAVR
ncbi:MAG TPA: MATE family efflux transporter, partial [Candidatus Nitrosotenuis sp.]|nr:MATE family efflux transporter [Candidatus Nitrosotenuis sp.]